MVEIVWTFDVQPEKQAEYLKNTVEKIKPFWESHGCSSYDVWQATDGEVAFMKRAVFPNMASIKKHMELAATDPEAMSIVELFRSFVPNSIRRTYIKKT